MFSQFFGNYLLKRRLINPEQLREVLALQDAVRVKIGILAIDAGYMNAAQVEEVHHLQTSLDKRFGEIAIDKGYLDEDQLNDVLGQQNKRHLLVSQALIDKEIMTFEQVETALIEYKKESGLSEVEFEALKNNDLDTVSKALVKLPDLGDPTVYTEYFSLFIRNLIRFIDNGIAIEPAEKIAEQELECLIHQELVGRFRIFTGLAGPEEGMAEFARRFAKMEVNGMDEVGRDALGEFMNVHNGLFLSKLSNDWVELELYPAEYKQGGSIKAVGVVYAIPFSLPFGSFTFYLGLGSPVIR